MTTGFAAIAEYHEYFMIESWRRLITKLIALPAPKHVVELGAGSGLGTVRMARLWPEARFTVVEPDDAMRAMFAARVQSVPGLSRRVEVLPLAVCPKNRDFLLNRIQNFDLLIGIHVLEFLSAEDRAVVLDLARQLPEGGRFVSTVGSPHSHDELSVELGKQRIVQRAVDGTVGYLHLDSDGAVLRESRLEQHGRPGHGHGHRALADQLQEIGFPVVESAGLLWFPDAPHMPEPDLATLTAQHNRWLAKLDPLCGPAQPPTVAEDAPVIQVPGDAQLTGIWSLSETPADASYALWVPDVLESLVFRSTTLPSAEEFAQLLRAWQVARQERPATLRISVPALAVELTPALLETGFSPMSTSVAQFIDGRIPEPNPDIDVRPPEKEDREQLLDLLMELHASDMAAGTSEDRPNARELYGKYLDEGLATPDWVWVAWDEGHPIGFLSLSSIENSQWAAPMVSVEKFSYLGLLVVSATERRSGIGATLTAHAMTKAKNEGVELILLDHATLSPLSSTFWHRQGFRPLRTLWEKEV